jgi:glutamate synthase (NADPH/NADH) small chain
MSSNFEFIDIKRIEPETKSIKVRKIEFGEIYQTQNLESVKEQSSRCLDCGNPYCEWKCPLHNYIPDWLKLAQIGSIHEAADLCHETNSFPEICGRICPQEKLCEGACTLNTGYEAVTIGQIEKYITDKALSEGWKPKKLVESSSKKTVSIIGAGPAGLACAENLIRRGVKCIVYDRYSQIGGLLTYGIPEFKLEKNIVIKRREILEELGVEFVLNFEVDEKRMNEIEKNSDAIFLGLGTYESIKGNINGLSKDGVVEALPYLIKNTEYLMSEEDAENIDFRDKKVVVLGGGDTAMDCVRTAIRQQAKSVYCVYRRDKENMPGSVKEIKHAMEEGVEFLFNSQPLEIIGNGTVRQLKIGKTKLGKADGSGRKKPVLIKNSEKILDVDKLVIAFGYEADPQSFIAENNIKVSDRGLISLDNENYKYQTSNPKFFAGGDMIIGSSLAVHAIAHGRDAAKEIIKFLET